MNKVVEELDRTLRQLDRATAEHVERLVRDALALASVSPTPLNWPAHYFERTCGALVDEKLERPDQGAMPTRGEW